MSAAEAVQTLVWQAKGRSIHPTIDVSERVNVWKMQDDSFVVHHIDVGGHTILRERFDTGREAVDRGKEVAADLD